jgi:hypothetical protein
MKSCLPNFPDSTRPRRDGTPSDWRTAGARQNTLPPLNFEHVSFLPKPEVIEDNSPESWALWDAAVRAGVFHGVKK